MNKILRKDFFREIRNSFGRFLAILSIVLLGVAFFAGVCASPQVMLATADQYFKDYKLQDIQVLSSMGFDQKDVKRVRAFPEIQGVQPTFSMDVLGKNEKSESDCVFSLYSIPSDLSKKNSDYLNRLRLYKGRLPEKENEIVLRYTTARSNPVSIGDQITVTSGTDTPIEDSLSVQKFKVVGIVYTPSSISFNLGNSNIGNGTVTYLGFVPESVFKSKYYTHLFLKVKGTDHVDCFDEDAYFGLTDPVVKELKKLGKKRIAARISEAKAEIHDQVEKKVTKTVTQKVTEKVAASVKSEIEKETLQMVEAKTRAALEATVPPALLPMVMNERFQGMVDENYPAALEQAMAENYQKIVDRESAKQIQKVLPKQIKKIYRQQVQKNLKDSDTYKWYVLDRNSQASYVEYKSAADQMKQIAIIFPIFFFFVAALVCFTTMTRMVDEQRQLIGTYKALGYGKWRITFRYMAYAGLAATIGGLLGVAIGSQVFPLVIFNAWKIAYQMPEMVQVPQPLLYSISVLAMVLIVVLSAFLACFKDLMSTTAVLMRPKAPKVGKKIWIEHFPKLWKKLSFSWKVTVRNIFRYKRRFIMTLAGVAGCTALLVMGFGISDSINHIVDVQFEELITYNTAITLKENISKREEKKLHKNLSNSSDFSNCTFVHQESGNANRTKEAEKQKDASILILSAKDDQTLKSAYVLRDPETQKSLTLPKKGVLISKKLAKDYNLSAGDTFYLENKDGVRKPVVVKHIVEVYINNYAFMSNDYYESVFGTKPYENTCLVQHRFAERKESALGEKWMNHKNVENVVFYSATINTVRKMISALSLITWVLILSSALLSFVVLYNLSNVNISERFREIATIKVLGFYPGEVNAYVYRENITITILGALLGLPLGIFVHHLIMGTIDMESITFGNYIAPVTYIYSFLLTLLFSAVVSIFVNRKLKKIPMVESLKSVE